MIAMRAAASEPLVPDRRGGGYHHRVDRRFADVFSPYDPLRNSFRTRLRPPDETFWFGTDHFGRDILSRVIHGARISLIIGLMTAL